MRCLKRAGPSRVWLIERPGQARRTLKTWPLTPLLALKLLFGQAQPQRQLRGARRLARLKINTPEPLGPLRLRRSGRWWQAAIELAFVPGRSALEIVRDGEVDGGLARRCGRQLGRAVRALAEAGLVHRDLKLNNVLVAGSGTEPVVWILDSVGVRRTLDRRRALVRMLERLYLQASDQPAGKQRRAWAPVLRAALAGLPAPERRAAVYMLLSYISRRSTS